MSTNYYWHEDTCGTCGHAKRRFHVGKSSGGGFSWQALGQYDSPTGKTVDSVDAWRGVFQRQGKLMDEYGAETSHVDFWAMVDDARKRDADRLAKGQDKARELGFRAEDGSHFIYGVFF